MCCIKKHGPGLQRLRMERERQEKEDDIFKVEKRLQRSATSKKKKDKKKRQGMFPSREEDQFA